jgi:hypothetical protein
LNAVLSTNHLSFRNQSFGTAIVKRGTQGREGNTRPTCVKIDHAGILEIFAKSEVRFEELTVNPGKSARLLAPDPLCRG